MYGSARHSISLRYDNTPNCHETRYPISFLFKQFESILAKRHIGSRNLEILTRRHDADPTIPSGPGKYLSIGSLPAPPKWNLGLNHGQTWLSRRFEQIDWRVVWSHLDRWFSSSGDGLSDHSVPSMDAARVTKGGGLTTHSSASVISTSKSRNRLLHYTKSEEEKKKCKNEIGILIVEHGAGYWP